jgi:hypothetical protein
MPKKTKKEKALAQARRIVQNARIQSSSDVLQTVQTKASDVRPVSTFEFKVKPVASVIAKTSASDEQEFIAIRKDIIKTVVLAGIAIACEFVVYLKLG